MIFLVYVEHGLKQLSIDMLSIKLNTQYLKSRLISLLFKKLCDQVTKLYISGALIQIWTGDLSLTKGVLYHWAIRAISSMERETRIELATCSLEGCHSTNWVTPACWYWPLISKSNGGGRRIRTFETFVAELQSAPFGRSGIPPYRTYLQRHPLFNLSTLRWCRHTDSNCGPTDYKSVALPTELCRLYLNVWYVSYRNGVQFSKTHTWCKQFF